MKITSRTRRKRMGALAIGAAVGVFSMPCKAFLVAPPTSRFRWTEKRQSSFTLAPFLSFNSPSPTALLGRKKDEQDDSKTSSHFAEQLHRIGHWFPKKTKEEPKEPDNKISSNISDQLLNKIRHWFPKITKEEPKVPDNVTSSNFADRLLERIGHWFSKSTKEEPKEPDRANVAHGILDRAAQIFSGSSKEKPKSVADQTIPARHFLDRIEHFFYGKSTRELDGEINQNTADRTSKDTPMRVMRSKYTQLAISWIKLDTFSMKKLTASLTRLRLKLPRSLVGLPTTAMTSH